jgi:hypothetical protein
LSKRKPGKQDFRPKKGGPARGKKRPHADRSGPSSSIRVRHLPAEKAWELVLPRCARDRQEDLEEVRFMLEQGEFDVARDECLWLLEGCTDCLEAHYLLGEIALGDNDFPLARGHFGYAFQLGAKAIERAGRVAPVPHRLPANRIFHEAGKALVYCLLQLGKPEMATEVIDTLLQADSTDPLGVAQLAAGGGGCGAADS